MKRLLTLLLSFSAPAGAQGRATSANIQHFL